MKKTREGLEQGEGGVTRFSVKLSFSSANVTDCDGARCHIAVPVNTQYVEGEGVCLLIHRKKAVVLVVNKRLLSQSVGVTEQNCLNREEISREQEGESKTGRKVDVEQTETAQNSWGRAGRRDTDRD